MLDPKFVKESYLKWHRNHPDADLTDEYGVPHLWWLLNFLGELIEWQDNPFKWEEPKPQIPKADRRRISNIFLS